MKVVLISNYYTHHQSSFCEAMYKITFGEFCFIETSPMSDERKNMGWSSNQIVPFLKKTYTSAKEREECKRLIDNADFVIKGDGPYDLIYDRLREGKMTFIYSERIYKNNKEKIKIPLHFFRLGKKYRGYSNLYLLCASAFASADFRRIGCFTDKAFKWGYFTELRTYEDIDSLFAKKEQKNAEVSILWAARLIGWKHPESAVAIAKRLNDEGVSFTMNIIGSGDRENDLEKMIDDLSLHSCVNLLGSMSPEEVRNQMEASDIFLFTSDKNEGWGAVLNESMNSACAVVASHRIGAVPYLIEDGVNGLIYKDGNLDDLYEKVKWLIERKDVRRDIANRAYLTISKHWNADEAASRLLSLASSLQNDYSTPYDNGVCSKAPYYSDNWYK